MPLLRVGPSDLFYRDDDFADPWAPHDVVMLQHGFGRSGNMFYGWVPPLSRHFRVIRADLRGTGRSADPGPDVEFTLDSVMSDFAGLLDALEIDKVHFVGESLGSMLGIAFAATHPDRVKSLTLVSSILRARHETTGSINAVGFPTWSEALQVLGMKEWWLRSREVTGQLTGNAAKDNWFADECGRTPLHVAQALLRFVPTLSTEPMLAKVKVPTLLLTPGQSKHTNSDEQRAVLETIKDSRQIRYPEATHIDCFLKPDAFARDTCEFLRQVSGR